MSTYADLVADGREARDNYVDVDRRGDRAVVTLTDPEKLNVLSAPLVQQLRAALESLARDPDVRAIVLTGADPGFSAGGDLRMMREAVEGTFGEAEGTTDIWRWIRYEFGGIARLIARTDKAFIGAINGPAAGVGLAWALTCDVVVASERARIVPAFGRLGLLPEVGTSWALTRRLGYQGAFAYFASGEHLDAEAARAAGLVQEVVPHDELLAAADRWCDKVCALPPHALAMGKALLRGAADATWDGALAMEEFAEPNCFTTRRFAESVEGLLTHGA
jgi:2-(1,2-epoxy-1,2-dihydrophenyl)acetyl-CoA isomerase